MPPTEEKSSLKRARTSEENLSAELKKPRRSERLSSQQSQEERPKHNVTPLKKSQLPSPLTRQESTTPDAHKEGTKTPEGGRPSQIRHRTPLSSPSSAKVLSPPQDTQPFSQHISPSAGFSSQVQDEQSEGVWGYLISLDHKFGKNLVLKKRAACPVTGTSNKKHSGVQKIGRKKLAKEEQGYERSKINGVPSGGYLIGRHPECDAVIDVGTISNRHCLIFPENKTGDTVAILEDLSGNGTFVNENFVGRNKRRELQEGDEIAVLDEARFVFRYPRMQHSNAFKQQYAVAAQLGKGHFATVYLAVEKSTGIKYAVKKFDKRMRSGSEKALEGLQQEIGVLMGVSHPNVLCLKDTFDEKDGIHLVLELAPEGELFNLIVSRGKVSESDTRKIFIQLLQGLKYLHERNVVHRDIKPENILLLDKDLTVKLADFGLAKIIGEDSFTTTLCGTPSSDGECLVPDVAPEILANSRHRRYSKAVDIWSLGVVLYICLCGFPPFSEELNTPQHPYTLIEQIRSARFDYPSPYWDPVSDAALDLIDSMLTVDVDRRIDVDGCLEHPWTTAHEPKTLDPGKSIESTDSTSSLTGRMDGLGFEKRRTKRERTLLSQWNDVRVADVLPSGKHDAPPVKIFAKNETQESNGDAMTSHADDDNGQPGPSRNQAAAVVANQPAERFLQMGGQGEDTVLFGDDPGSRYVPEDDKEHEGTIAPRS